MFFQFSILIEIFANSIFVQHFDTLDLKCKIVATFLIKSLLIPI